jgi:DNA polymerase I-like protein with 3'-5' exonuclease and polymerase domains
MTEGLSNVKLHLVDSVEKAQKFVAWAAERRPHNAVSVDIETGEIPGNNPKDALSPWHGQIRLAQVGDGQQGWAIPWDSWKGVYYQVMNKYDGPIVCHNIAFEAKWFAINSDWDMPWAQAHDTMLMAQVIDPLGPAALKQLAARYVDSRSVALQDTLGKQFSENGWTWGTVPTSFEPYWSYGALDTVLTMRIWEQFYEKCGPGKPYSIPYELEMATRKISTRMEINGARVDLEYSQKKLDELTSYTENVKLKIRMEDFQLQVLLNYLELFKVWGPNLLSGQLLGPSL